VSIWEKKWYVCFQNCTIDPVGEEGHNKDEIILAEGMREARNEEVTVEEGEEESQCWGDWRGGWCRGRWGWLDATKFRLFY